MSAARVALHFAHANGFPGACYRKLFSGLAADFDVGYLPASGHDPRFPVTDGWPLLVEELIASIVERGQAPVLGVGHSLGGYLTLLAALRRPELFRAIILLDAPILGTFRGTALQLVKRIGLIDRVTPAATTRNRRREWPSLEAALEHFRRKRLFRDFDPDCLRDYVHYGTRPSMQSTPGGGKRVWGREWSWCSIHVSSTRSIAPFRTIWGHRHAALPSRQDSSADANLPCWRAPG